MEEMKITIQEAQQLLLMSQSSVYAWIDKGKLQTVETPSGKFIVISKKEAEEIRENNLKSKRNKTSKQFLEQNKEFSSEIPTLSAEFHEEIQNKNAEISGDSITLKLISELKEMALDAGKYKQLEIIRNEEKEKFEFWQSEYFKLNAELNEKNAQINELKKEIEELKSLQDKRKSFFGIKF